MYIIIINCQLSTTYQLHIIFFFGLSVLDAFGYFFGVLGLTDACCSKIQNRIQIYGGEQALTSSIYHPASAPPPFLYIVNSNPISFYSSIPLSLSKK